MADLSEYRGSTYPLFMLIRYPSYAHRIPNVSPGSWGCTWKDIWVSLHGAYNRRAYIRDFTVLYFAEFKNTSIVMKNNDDDNKLPANYGDGDDEF